MTGCGRQRLGAPSVAPASVEPRTAADSLAIQRQQELSGGRYSWAQAKNIWARNMLLKTFHYPGRDNPAVVRELAARCTQTGSPEKQAQGRLRVLWQNMQTLKNRGIVTGPALADFSVRTGVFYCHRNIDAGTAGTWTSAYGVSDINSDTSYTPLYSLLIQAHETIHGLQDMTGVNYDPTLALPDWQTSVLSYEAAARVGEMIAALDLMEGGNYDLWSSVNVNYSNSVDLARIIGAYRHERAVENSVAGALTEAGRIAFYQVFRSQEWLDYYNHRILNNYFDQMMQGNLSAPSGRVYTLETARRTGWVSDDLNYTATLDRLPTVQERFGSNQRMRHAFDYVHLDRLAQVHGYQSPVYKAEHERLVKDRNPFMGLNLDDVHAAREASGVRVLTIMNDMEEQLPRPPQRSPAP